MNIIVPVPEEVINRPKDPNAFSTTRRQFSRVSFDHNQMFADFAKNIVEHYPEIRRFQLIELASRDHQLFLTPYWNIFGNKLIRQGEITYVRKGSVVLDCQDKIISFKLGDVTYPSSLPKGFPRQKILISDK